MILHHCYNIIQEKILPNTIENIDIAETWYENSLTIRIIMSVKEERNPERKAEKQVIEQGFGINYN